MASYDINSIQKILNAQSHIVSNDIINHLIYDSRSLVSTTDSLFFALKGKHRDGHNFIKELYDRNIKNFVVSQLPKDIQYFKNANFLVVSNTLNALQQIAKFHRNTTKTKIVGVTGSNGKTIVKEWLYHVLYNKQKVIRSPKSYNSSIGVPLSVWLMDEGHETAIFEAGISFPGEMQSLSLIIKPDIGIFTNIGDAHQENFQHLTDKINEKLILFEECNTLIYNKDHKQIHECIINNKNLKTVSLFSWSAKEYANLQIKSINNNNNGVIIKGVFENNNLSISIPFIDKASIENAIHVWSYMLCQRFSNDYISMYMKDLPSVAMRLELKEGLNSCTIINDSYNSDIGSLSIALDFLNQQNQHDNKTLILSDILQSGLKESDLYNKVHDLLKIKGIQRFIGIGKVIARYRDIFPNNSEFYSSTEDFLAEFNSNNYLEEAILLKGARVFRFEKISIVLEKKSHRTVMEINLTAMANNLKYYKDLLPDKTGIIAVVKAFSYGTGSFEIANLLQYHGVDYLAVAYIDEGVQLRKAGINIPILVMNPYAGDFNKLTEYTLEPEIYNFRTLKMFVRAAKKDGTRTWPVHIKLNTGMNRLGFVKDDLPDLINELQLHNYIKVNTIFSHLAGSNKPEADQFSKKQIVLFDEMYRYIQERLDYQVKKHLLNSSGIERFSDAAYDYVRIGIGLYGEVQGRTGLNNVCSLKTTISQIQNVVSGGSIGYNMQEVVKSSTKIAVLPIGYADGINRKFGNRNGSVLINGKKAVVVGEICMDMMMVDITGIQTKEGDQVTIFSEKNPISKIAEQLDTIPYEVLAGISTRVKRVYITE